MANNTVRTRFAPSPTGYMHVGNLRTALYAYLKAKSKDGTFILRIEDTDQERYVDGAVDIIYNTLRQTGLLWDEGPDVGGPVGPYVQSERMGMFKEYAEQLVKAGQAYYCFCTPERLVQEALRLQREGNIGLAYTYNEPLVGYEYVRDCAGLVHRAGMVNVLVTNGTIEKTSWRALLPLIDAVNIDLKGFTESWYRKLGGDLETVKRSILLAAEHCHVEITTLIVPGENDSEEEMRALSAWLASVSPEIPLHVSRFFPRYRMQGRPPTPVRTVYRLAEVARESLRYVYTGNC